VVLLDEPLAALDQQLRQEMQVELKTIQEKAGLTCVCVTHHQEEAMMMSDRIAVMHQGRMWQVGSPREVYAQPCNLFVSRFLGISNELPGKVGGPVGEQSLFQPADDELPPVLVQTVAGQPADRSATLSLRPEQLRMSRERPSTFDQVLSGRIEKSLFVGSEMKYLVRVGRDSLWEIRMTPGTQLQSYRPGEAVFLHWSAADGRLFFE